MRDWVDCQWFTSRLSALTSPSSFGLACGVRTSHRWVQRGQVVVKGGSLTLALFREVQKEGHLLVSDWCLELMSWCLYIYIAGVPYTVSYPVVRSRVGDEIAPYTHSKMVPLSVGELATNESSHCVAVYPVQGMEAAFLYAAYRGDLPRVKDLISQGCPVDAKNEVSYSCAYSIRDGTVQ